MQHTEVKLSWQSPSCSKLIKRQKAPAMYKDLSQGLAVPLPYCLPTEQKNLPSWVYSTRHSSPGSGTVIQSAEPHGKRSSHCSPPAKSLGLSVISSPWFQQALSWAQVQHILNCFPIISLSLLIASSWVHPSSYHSWYPLSELLPPQYTKILLLVRQGACQNSFFSKPVLQCLFPPTAHTCPPDPGCEHSLNPPVIHFCCFAWAGCADLLCWEAKQNTKDPIPILCPLLAVGLINFCLIVTDTRDTKLQQTWPRKPPLPLPSSLCIFSTPHTPRMDFGDRDLGLTCFPPAAAAPGLSCIRLQLRRTSCQPWWTAQPPCQSAGSRQPCASACAGDMLPQHLREKKGDPVRGTAALQSAPRWTPSANTHCSGVQAREQSRGRDRQTDQISESEDASTCVICNNELLVSYR